MLLDIHTHHLPPNEDEALFSACMKDKDSADFLRAKYRTAGIHPWYLTESDYPSQMAWIKAQLTSPRTLALGEAGLDKLCSTPSDLQQKAFMSLIGLSEQYRLPLLIHSVKTSNELIRLKQELRPAQPWIIHGFRGKKELAESLLHHGFYLSFGEKYQESAMASVPSDRLLLETDESLIPIRQLYEQAARIRKTTPADLAATLSENTNRLFFNR